MRNQDEHRLQVQICRYLDLTQSFPFFAVPNGSLRNKLVAIKLKMEGVKSGVSDLFLMVSNKNWNGIFMEVKTAKGVLSPNQKAFQKQAIAHGYYYAVVRSIEDCTKLLQEFKLNQI